MKLSPRKWSLKVLNADSVQGYATMKRGSEVPQTERP